MDKRLTTRSRLPPWNWFRNEDERSTGLSPRGEFEHPMARLHQEMDRLFDDAFRSFGAPSLFRESEPFSSETGAVLRPRVDIREEEDSYRISVEVPGVKEEDLKLRMDGDNLIISGEKHQEDSSDEKGKVHRVERSYGSFQRVLTLPQDAQSEDISARFENGVLNISVPRDTSKEAIEGRTIPIEKS